MASTHWRLAVLHRQPINLWSTRLRASAMNPRASSERRCLSERVLPLSRKLRSMVLRRSPGALAANRVIVGDCIAGAEEAARPFGRSRLRRPALQSAARRRSDAPQQYARRRRRRRLGQVRELRRVRRLLARLARRVPPRAEARRRHLGDRLLSQHLPPRRRAAGPRLLDPERRHLAQGQPDAELPRQALHQRARDADLGGARPARARDRSTTRA